MSKSVAIELIHRCRSAAAILFLISGATACAAAPSSEDNGTKLCDEFRVQLERPMKLSPYAVEGKEVEEGIWEISGFDVDGDRIADKIVRYCPGSGSIIPADPCTVEFEPSSVGKSFVLEEARLYVFEYQSHLYIIGGGKDTEDGPDHVRIYDFTPSGVRKLCSYEM